jgi:hypothetical protein
MRRAAALANLVDAELDRMRGKRASARKRLNHCVHAFEEQGMHLFSAAARARLGQVEGGSLGDQLLRDARQEFSNEGVAEPDRMIALLAPGDG